MPSTDVMTDDAALVRAVLNRIEPVAWEVTGWRVEGEATEASNHVCSIDPADRYALVVTILTAVDRVLDLAFKAPA